MCWNETENFIPAYHTNFGLSTDLMVRLPAITRHLFEVKLRTEVALDQIKYTSDLLLKQTKICINKDMRTTICARVNRLECVRYINYSCGVLFVLNVPPV